MFTNLTNGTDEVDPIIAHQRQNRGAPLDRPYVFTNMVSSMDGAIAIDGVSGALGGPADFEVFMALRSVADVILVGAGTARDERYKPPTARDETQTFRQQRGQAARPSLAVVTRSGRLPADLPMFDDPDNRPVVICGSDADESALRPLTQVAEIVRVATPTVDPNQTTALLHERGHRLVLLEGGPSLNGAFTEADLIDEWNLTLSPLLVGGSSGRAAIGDEGNRRSFAPSHVWSAEGLLFVQWLRTRGESQSQPNSQ